MIDSMVTLFWSRQMQKTINEMQISDELIQKTMNSGWIDAKQFMER